jgi:2,5-diamino-6-(ribosylamino)-4(3H)-pyrimidinone 5'-phosphate reductase
LNFKEELEELEKVIEELRVANESAPILVEGEKDRNALQFLGINGTILVLHRGKGIPALCDQIAANHKEIILLMDWDKKGRRLTHFIKQNLRGRIKINLKIRYKFAKTVGVRTIEGIPSYFATLLDKIKKR